FFVVVEQFMCEGSPAVQSVLAVGLFEDIQTITSHRRIDQAAFERWLGPQSLKSWRKVDADMRRVAESQLTRRNGVGIDVEKLLSEVRNPELRNMIETLYWKQ